MCHEPVLLSPTDQKSKVYSRGRCRRRVPVRGAVYLKANRENDAPPIVTWVTFFAFAAVYSAPLRFDSHLMADADDDASRHCLRHSNTKPHQVSPNLNQFRVVDLPPFHCLRKTSEFLHLYKEKR